MRIHGGHSCVGGMSLPALTACFSFTGERSGAFAFLSQRA